MAPGAEVSEIEIHEVVDHLPSPVPKRNFLTKLPPNLHVHVLGYLSVLDIITVRKTCKALHRATCLRAVWACALRRTRTQNALLYSTFPIDTMSTSSLESNATAPYRFLSLLYTAHATTPARHGPRGGKPKALAHAGGTRTLSGGPKAWANNGAGIFLVPGGRYLLTFGDERISLWDLGGLGEEEPPERPLASVYYIYYNDPRFLVRPTLDGMGLRLAVHREGGYEVAVYEIFPGSSSPEFRRMAVYLISGDVCVKLLALSEDRAAFRVGNMVYLWDFVQDLSACWDVEHGFSETQIILSADTIFLLQDGTVLSWKVLSLHPPSDTRPHTSPELENNYFVFTIQNAEQEHGTLHSSLCGWYTGTTHSLILDYSFLKDPEGAARLEAEESGGENETLRAIFNLDNLSAREPLLLPQKSYTLEYDTCKTPYRICGPSLVQMGDFGDITARIVGSVVPENDESGTAIVEVPLYKAPRSRKDSQSSLCPVSGRLCTMKSQSTVRIMDYLAELPEKTTF